LKALKKMVIKDPMQLSSTMMRSMSLINNREKTD